MRRNELNHSYRKEKHQQGKDKGANTQMNRMRAKGKDRDIKYVWAR